LIEELSEKCNIDKDLALSFLTVFFEEIKKGMMDGEIIKIYKLGKFYVNGPQRGGDGKVVLPSENSTFTPKFKPSVLLKRKLSSQ